MSNPQVYKANNSNPLVKASLQGVVSHRIKTLLGGGTTATLAEASPLHHQIARLQAQSVIEYDPHQLSPSGSQTKSSIKKRHEKATRDNSLMLIN